jgi:hypothetical protein
VFAAIPQGIERKEVDAEEIENSDGEHSTNYFF